MPTYIPGYAKPLSSPKSSPYYYGGGTSKATAPNPRPPVAPTAPRINPGGPIQNFTPGAPIDQGASPTGGPPTGGGGGFGGFDLGNWNPDADPIVMRVQALNSQLISQAQATALANKKQALIEFGSPDVVQQILGSPDANTASAAQQNPFSTLAQLLTAHNQNILDTNEGMNKSNLFYSTARSLGLENEQKGYLQGQSNAQRDLNAKISSYNQAVLDAKNQAAQMLLQAQESSYMRALQIALAGAMGAYGGGGWSSGGSTPSGSTSPTGTSSSSSTGTVAQPYTGRPLPGLPSAY